MLTTLFPHDLQMAAVNLGVAMTCGAVIGSERQVRQRMAGLRTNALVALGAAAFVVFSGLFPDEVSPTRVAAQIMVIATFVTCAIAANGATNAATEVTATFRSVLFIACNLFRMSISLHPSFNATKRVVREEN